MTGRGAGTDRVAGAAFMTLLMSATLAHAQGAGAPTVSGASPSGVRLGITGYVQVDGRWVSEATTSVQDGLLVRRARLMFDASGEDGWHLRLQPDFGQGRVKVQDAFVGFA